MHAVLPPYMVERIARHGSDAQRDAALRTLAADATVRQARAANLAAPRIPDAMASLSPAGPDRTIADARGGTSVNGLRVVRSEGDPPSSDPAVDEAYDGLGATYAFWLEAYSRRSIDDAGMPLRGIVHYGQGYDNAFWDGRRMIFGDGDGELFTRFTRAIDVIGHELGHGVVEDEGPLAYQGQSGALNESLADVFGSMVKQHAAGQTAADADWLIGPDIRGPEFHGRALRSMLEPGTAYDDPVLGKDPQPADMSGYIETTEDNGGVHLNSGIPNKAFATLAVALGGHSWERAGRVWYDALRDSRLRDTSSFAQFARITHAVGTQAGIGDEVATAWSGVGIRVR